MVKATEDYEVLEVGCPSVDPVLLVVDLKPAPIVTAGVLATASGSCINESAQPSGNRPAAASHSDDVVLLRYHRFDYTVT